MNAFDSKADPRLANVIHQQQPHAGIHGNNQVHPGNMQQPKLDCNFIFHIHTGLITRKFARRTIFKHNILNHKHKKKFFYLQRWSTPASLPELPSRSGCTQSGPISAGKDWLLWGKVWQTGGLLYTCGWGRLLHISDCQLFRLNRLTICTGGPKRPALF